MRGARAWVGWVGLKLLRLRVATSVTSGGAQLTRNVVSLTGHNTRLVMLRRLRGALCFYRMRSMRGFSLTRPVPNPSARFCNELTGSLNIIVIASLFRHHTPKLCRGATIIVRGSKDVTKGCHGVRVPSSPTCCRGFCFAPNSLKFGPVRASINGLNMLIY